MSIVNVQDELLCAIELGDLSCVKRVVNGVGLDLNTVLHSSFRHENATVLGTAALEGQVSSFERKFIKIGDCYRTQNKTFLCLLLFQAPICSILEILIITRIKGNTVNTVTI